MRKTLSIVIPAYNEGVFIFDCLSTIFGQTRSHNVSFEVIVVCNGCSDDTANQARKLSSEFLTVIETSVASKTNALNMGDAAAKYFPRVYMDADVRMSFEDIVRLCDYLTSNPNILVVSPAVKLDIDKLDWRVKAFYKVWTSLPYFNEHVGFGVYAISEKGRARFSTFPDIIGDDEFIRRLYKKSESKRLTTVSYNNTPAGNLNGLIKQNVRTEYGNLQLRNIRFNLVEESGLSKKVTILSRIIAKPSIWPWIPLYFYIRAYAKIAARAKIYQGLETLWDRDRDSGLE